jgi:arginine-tRNA-protein transferase
MDYKTRFQPQEHLTPRGWERFDPESMPESTHD